MRKEIWQPRPMEREAFPASQEAPEGMKNLCLDPVDREGVLYEHDVPYIQRGEQTLHLQILRPSFGKAPFPLILYVQGSAWHRQEWLYPGLPKWVDVAREGFVVALVEYRATEDRTPFPAQLQDAKAALRFLRRHAQDYGIDPERVAVWGDSSGGHTALMLGMTDGIQELDAQDGFGESTAVSCIVDFYGPTDVSRMNDVPSTMDHLGAGSPEGMLVGGPVLERMETVRKASPLCYVDREAKLPPLLILHGNKDRLVPFQQSVLLYEAMRKAGREVEFYRLENADHGGAEFWHREVLDLCLDFIRRSMQ